MSDTLIPPSPALDAEPLQVQFLQTDGVCSLHLVGVLCGQSLHELERHIDVLGGTPFDAVHLDLSGLAGVDDCGHNVLLGLHHYVAARGGHWSISGASDAVATTLHDIPIAWSGPGG